MVEASKSWPEYHYTKVMNLVCIGLAIYTAYNRYGSDLSTLGLRGFGELFIWLLAIGLGHVLTLYAVSAPSRKRSRNIALAIFTVYLLLAIPGLYALRTTTTIHDNLNLTVLFVGVTIITNVWTLARLRR